MSVGHRRRGHVAAVEADRLCVGTEEFLIDPSATMLYAGLSPSGVLRWSLSLRGLARKIGSTEWEPVLSATNLPLQGQLEDAATWECGPCEEVDHALGGGLYVLEHSKTTENTIRVLEAGQDGLRVSWTCKAALPMVGRKSVAVDAVAWAPFRQVSVLATDPNRAQELLSEHFDPSDFEPVAANAGPHKRFMYTGSSSGTKRKTKAKKKAKKTKATK